MISLGSAWHESLTYDEIFYKEEGLAILNNGAYLDPYIPPLAKVISAVPIVLGAESIIPSSIPAQKLIVSRALTVLMSVGLVWFIYSTACRQFGAQAGIVALVLAAFEPTLLANNHFLTNDVPLTFFVFVSYVSFMKLAKRPGIARALATGALFGCALATKLTAVFLLLPLVAIGRSKKIILVLTAIVTLWAVYGFKSEVIIAQRDDPERLSERIISHAATNQIPAIASVITFLQTKPIPLGTYLALVKNAVIRSTNPIQNKSFQSMPLSIVLKTPIPLLAFFLLAVVKISKISPVMIFPVVMTMVATTFGGFLPLVRYALPMYPFVILISSLSLKSVKTKTAKLLYVFLLGWYIFGSIREYPHFIGYANELAGPANGRYRYFTDSNIDWGQSLPDMAEYVERQKPLLLLFSYFGRDDGSAYGLNSTLPWGSFTFDEICAFHPIQFSNRKGPTIRAISVSNWYGCGYHSQSQFSSSRIKDIVGGSVLIF